MYFDEIPMEELMDKKEKLFKDERMLGFLTEINTNRLKEEKEFLKEYLDYSQVNRHKIEQKYLGRCCFILPGICPLPH